MTSENISVDPVRHLILSAVENGNFQIIDAITGNVFNSAVNFGLELNATAEDCITGIAAAPDEFTASIVFVRAPCNVPARLTGNPACMSKWGTYDMGGNMWEWVGEWTDLPLNGNGADCTNWPSDFGNDPSCVGGPGGPGFFSLPGAPPHGDGFCQ